MRLERAGHLRADCKGEEGPRAYVIEASRRIRSTEFAVVVSFKVGKRYYRLLMLAQTLLVLAC